ncbi:uncharacterized protein RAG0_17485 [Rhynchosporium agropyri]|uniref:Uncharacterized protein n=1 Tax=Rhynchosporium agropyri TaxID=914238 RepID=A0A1E1LTU9_9HELO|nr:uncharacterized protein RAG0_17485 [Rhynchosporium agropyri]
MRDDIFTDATDPTTRRPVIFFVLSPRDLLAEIQPYIVLGETNLKPPFVPVMKHPRWRISTSYRGLPYYAYSIQSSLNSVSWLSDIGVELKGSSKNKRSRRVFEVRYYTESDTSYTGILMIPVNLSPGIYPSPYITFSTILVVASKSGSELYLLYLFTAGVEFNILSLDYNIVTRLLNYINTEYIILSGLLIGSETRDPELNRGGIVATYKAIDQIYRLAKSATPTTILEITIDLDILTVDSAKSRTKELNTIIREFAKKAIFKAIISDARGKRNLPSGSETASDLDTPGPSLKKKARGLLSRFCCSCVFRSYSI